MLTAPMAASRYSDSGISSASGEAGTRLSLQQGGLGHCLGPRGPQRQIGGRGGGCINRLGGGGKKGLVYRGSWCWELRSRSPAGGQTRKVRAGGDASAARCSGLSRTRSSGMTGCLCTRPLSALLLRSRLKPSSSVSAYRAAVSAPFPPLSICLI